MDARTKWLLKQPIFWLGIFVAGANILIASGAFNMATAGGRTLAGVLSLLSSYGIRGLMLAPPRVPLAEMTDAEREKVFAANPQVRARWEAQQQQLSGPSVVPSSPSVSSSSPPPLPPPPAPGEK